MSFEVIPADLTSAADHIVQAVSTRACHHVPLSNLNAAAYGDVGLAEWMNAVGEDADTALRDLEMRGEGIAQRLRDCAATYAQQDACVTHHFRPAGSSRPGP